MTSGDPSRELGNVVSDTRTLRAGDFFVALRGARFDAHDFVGEAIAKGAGGVLVETGRDLPASAGRCDGHPAITKNIFHCFSCMAR